MKARLSIMVSPPLSRKSRCFTQNLHFPSQTLILFVKAVQFHRISFLTPLRFGKTKRLNLKPPRLQLPACYSKLLRDTALGCPSS
jgi:hypothetical protein